jgi:hypothetical protein
MQKMAKRGSDQQEIWNAGFTTIDAERVSRNWLLFSETSVWITGVNVSDFDTHLFFVYFLFYLCDAILFRCTLIMMHYKWLCYLWRATAVGYSVFRIALLRCTKL